MVQFLDGIRCDIARYSERTQQTTVACGKEQSKNLQSQKARNILKLLRIATSVTYEKTGIIPSGQP